MAEKPMDPTERTQRLYNLLPVIYRLRDADQGYPLRDLLQIISSQVNLLEDDIAQLYDNWFIETAEDWVVPYIADLIGYRAVSEGALTAASDAATDTDPARADQRERILIPRREV